MCDCTAIQMCLRCREDDDRRELDDEPSREQNEREQAARVFIEASIAEADRVVRTGRAVDPKAAEWKARQGALSDLIAAGLSGQTTTGDGAA